MRYREAYFREEIEQYYKDLQESNIYLTHQNEVNPTKQRKMEDKIKGMVLSLKLSMEKFNATCYDQIEHVTKQFSTKAEDTFDKYATGFGMIIEQYLDAQSTGDILQLCKDYNEGKLTDYLQASKNIEAVEPAHIIGTKHD